ncbi:MAG: type I deoxyribonuclease HsdR [Thermonema sp.]|uniref:HTTM domain-containing protein n=1 Tax=Thermonema sp. TaxID=2231181 RepID=UPI0021DEC9F3|nr:HTTM domain-containing protein [Thermonema sp.]GIV40561.1 MAG: type I deoxyribonuclease HsdR [Thermonema sp.]
MQLKKSLWHAISRPVSVAPLATFRFIFGVAMFISTLRFLWMGWVYDHYIAPKLHFHYFGFEWIEPAPAWALYAIHGLMLLAALGMALGYRYRLSAVLFFLCFTYTELIDITYYLNHYYFVSLVSFVMIFLPAHYNYSLDARLGKVQAVRYVERWQVGIVRFLLAMVYFYAGVAKINDEWLLHALPLRIWLPAHNDMPLLGPAFNYPLTAYVFSWAGMLYDTLIPFFLLNRRTRPFAYIVVLFFHGVTGYLFQIGMFPLIMSASVLVFFSSEWHERLWQRYLPGWQVATQAFRPASFPRLQYAFWALFVCFQVLFPWRYLLYPGNLFWNEDGFRFSWRVMLIEKAGTATFFVRDRQSGHEWVIDNREFLNTHQEKQMAMQPDLILQFAHYLHDYYEKQGVADPIVRAEVYVTLNGRPSSLYFSPDLDLSRLEDSWAPRRWLYPAPPLQEPPFQGLLNIF